MTQAQAADLQAKVMHQDSAPLCEHPIEELRRLTQSVDGYTTGAYHCRECGETIVRTYRVPPFSNAPLID